MAVADSLIESEGHEHSVDFKHVLQVLNDLNIQVRSETNRSRRVKTKFKTRRLISKVLGTRARYRGFLKLSVPRRPINSIEDFWNRVNSISHALRGGLFIEANNHVRLVSLPIGPSPWGYPMNSLRLIDSSLRLHYSLIALQEAREREVAELLPKRDRNWRGGLHHAELLLDIPMRVFNPFFYDPYYRLRPNRWDYEIFKEGKLTRRLTSLARGRARLRWFTVSYRRLAMIGILYGALQLPSVFDGLDDWVVWSAQGVELSPEQKKKLIQNMKAAESILPTEADIDQARQELWEEFSIPIRKLEEEIKKTGDPSGRLKKQLEEAIEIRDFVTQ